MGGWFRLSRLCLPACPLTQGAPVVRPREPRRGETSWSAHRPEEGSLWPPTPTLGPSNSLAAIRATCRGGGQEGRGPASALPWPSSGPLRAPRESGPLPRTRGRLPQLVLFPAHTPGRVGNEGLFLTFRFCFLKIKSVKSVSSVLFFPGDACPCRGSRSQMALPHPSGEGEGWVPGLGQRTFCTSLGPGRLRTP